MSSNQQLLLQPSSGPDPQVEQRIAKLSRAVEVIPPVSAELSATKAAVDHLARQLSLTSGEERGWRNQQHESLTALRNQVGDLRRELQAVTVSVEDATADATGAKQAGARQVAALHSAQSELADAVAALEDKMRCARASICAERLWPMESSRLHSLAG